MRAAAEARRPQRLLPLLGLFLLVPASAMLLLSSHSGHAWLVRIGGHTQTTAMLPGITVETAPRPTAGLVITSVRSDSQAAEQGIAVGDSIVAIDGIPIFTLAQANSYLQKDKARVVELWTLHGRRSRYVRLGREGVRK
jgi:S1-C subfamily serine protease